MKKENLMTKYLQNAIKEQKEKRHQSPLEDKILIRNKLKEYTKLVKDLHPPVVSQVKVQEMQALKDASTNLRDENKKKMLHNLKTTSRYHQEINGDRQREFTVPSHKVAKNHKVYNFENKLLPQPKEKKIAVVVDFLRLKREQKSVKSTDSKFQILIIE